MTLAHADTNLEYWSPDYWLGHCEGFRVVDDNGRLGFVEEVHGDEDEPDELIVRGGLVGNRILRIPVEAIQEIQPRHECVLVRTDRELAG
jgi:hypothetical protein